MGNTAKEVAELRTNIQYTQKERDEINKDEITISSGMIRPSGFVNR